MNLNQDQVQCNLLLLLYLDLQSIVLKFSQEFVEPDKNLRDKLSLCKLMSATLIIQCYSSREFARYLSLNLCDYSSDAAGKQTESPQNVLDLRKVSSRIFSFDLLLNCEFQIPNQ